MQILEKLKNTTSKFIYFNEQEKYGKHSYEDHIEELKAVVERKDREIQDIKEQCINEFEHIKNLCFVSDYDKRYNAFCKIEEIASDNIYALMKDLQIENDIEDKKAKIIELATIEN